jgi:predicted glycoside hydrolase/deacetylase ChbG (UPF0249 family)
LPNRDQLYRSAVRQRLDGEEIAGELARQLDAFERAMGRAPDFLDGHHHVHQLPGVREVVARAWCSRGLKGWIRNTATSPTHILARAVAMPRAAVLASFGRAARRTWMEAGIPTNTDFAGVRNFAVRRAFDAMMRRYLRWPTPGLLIMCHPGRAAGQGDTGESAMASRPEELAYLLSEEFPRDLEAAGCRLARLSSLLAPQTSFAGG